MRMQNTLPALVVGLALAGLASVSPADTAKADLAKIDKLVEQLGSDTFAEREEASAALAKIGMPALGALRKAITGTDSEVRKRAKDLLTKLEKEASSAEVLTPTQVHLVYKDTPLKVALDDLKKKTGAQIVLHDPTNKLKDTKVTLDTGKTTFWDALDKFCDAAGVVEGDANAVGGPGRAIAPPRLVPLPGVKIAPIAVPLPGVKLQPAVELPVAPAEKAPVKAPGRAIDKKALPDCGGDGEAKAVEAEKEAEAKAKAEAQAKADAKAKADAQAKEAAKAKMAARPIAIQIQIAPIGPGGMMMPGAVGVPGQPGRITLVPGTRAKVPTDASSSIRVRIGDKSKIPAVPNAKEIDLALQVSLEPKLRWQSLVGVTIDKAIDDNGVKLKQAAKANPAGNPGVGGVIIGGGAAIAVPIRIGPGGVWGMDVSTGMHHYVPVKLEKGAQASKSLVELTGTIAAYVQTPAEAMITVASLAKAKGKTVKGKADNGEIEVTSYTKAANGTVTIEFSLIQPENVTPETQLDIPVAMPPMVAPPAAGIRLRPVIVPGGAGAAPAPGAVGALMPAMPMMTFAPYGLTLRDDKDNVLPSSIQVDWRKARGGFGGPGSRLEFVATYAPAKVGAAEPAKLVFSARKTVAIDIPFTLKKVVLE